MKNKSVVVFSAAIIIFVSFILGFLIGRNTGNSNVIVSYNKTTTTTPISSTNQSVSVNKININTADESLLCELPGIGPKIAQRIIEYRQEHGSFKTIQEITNVSGIGDKTFQSLESLITVGGEYENSCGR